ncbi:MAG TPA: hypothetical protein VHU86_11375 [Solirubrobacterales bacterium]|jgi:hypothetical protein|nr:hypothetical protein [Solirubrobacterales bacterium]
MRLQPQHQAEYERGAERLFETVVAAGASEAGFAGQVRAALGATLAFLASEPELAHLLVVEPCRGDRAASESYRAWRGRFAGLLRRAAAASPDALVQPPFVEAILIGGVRWQLAQLIVGDRATAIDDLVPDLERYVLCYYLPPQLANPAAATDNV